MHELSIAEGLVAEACRVAAQHRARRIDTVFVKAGALSGVEPPLLQRAFTVARAGTVARDARLLIELGPVEVLCPQCGTVSGAAVNRIVCQACGNWRVEIVSGEELILSRLELSEIGEEREQPCVTPADAP